MQKHTEEKTMKKYKFFLDFTKEEAWLNGMGRQGFKLLKHENRAYVFEETDQTYQYQIYWENRSAFGTIVDTNSQEEDFLKFLDEFGIQTVQSYNGRNYLMSQGKEGLNLFSHREERIQQLKRVRKLYSSQWLTLIIFASFTALSLWDMFLHHKPLPQPVFTIIALLLALSIKLVLVAHSYSQKIKELERAKEE